MANEQHEKLTVMFADVAGSTQLYDVLGDIQAQRQIARCLTDMANIVEDNQGKVVKTIGDELMCQFPDVDLAVRAACDIQRFFNAHAEDSGTQVRIGLHCGDAILADEDLYGDTVNVAARMTDLARAREIVTSQQTIDQLQEKDRVLVREFNRTLVKGKREEMVIYQVIWERESCLLTSAIPTICYEEAATTLLFIQYRGREKKFVLDAAGITLGRNQQCDLVIDSTVASRFHARFQWRRGKLMLTDTSTNGTYLKIPDGREVYLHREELLLPEQGIISLGIPVADDNQDAVYFKCSHQAF